MAISVVSFLFSSTAQPEARLSLTHLMSSSADLQLSIGGPEGPFCWVVAFPTTTCLQLLWSPTHLSYIIVQSPTQSLEWHVWSSSSGNNCHAVHRSLSSGVSVYECTMGFYLVSYRQQNPPTRFLLINAFGMCHFFPVHHFGMACLAGSKVNIHHSHTHKNLRTCKEKQSSLQIST